MSEVKNWNDLKEIDSPLINEYCKFKEEFAENIVFFQVGEFFEVYCEDAVATTKAFSSTGMELTARKVGGKNIQMCGVPSAHSDKYANTLAKLGYSVTLISQSKINEVVERKFEQTYTPATITNEEFLNKDDNQYIMSAYNFKNELGVVVLDTLSGEIFTRLTNKYGIFDLIYRYSPKEVFIYLPQKWEAEMIAKLQNSANVRIFDVPYFYTEMKEAVDSHKAEYFKDEYTSYAIIAAHYFLISYLGKIQPNHVTLKQVHFIEERDYLYLHSNAMMGLDLLENNGTRKKDGSLFALLDQCNTPKGSRMLKKWIQEPSVDSKKIADRQEAVEFFMKNGSTAAQLSNLLLETTDIERNIARFETGKFKDYELVQLFKTIEKFHALLEITRGLNISWVKKVSSNLYQQTTLLIEELSQKICPEEIVKKGYDKDFDSIRDLKNHGKNMIVKYADDEKAKYNIKSCNLKENKVLGYFFEVTSSGYNTVPKHFEEKNTISNAKRFFTEELKTLESNYITAQEKYDVMYKKVCRRLVGDILVHSSNLRKVIDFVALMDILISFAAVSTKYRYQKPMLVSEDIIEIENALHPLLQAFSYKKVVSNNCKLSEEEIQIVTGPNMGGKSTYLKMVGLLVVMAQIGCYVPAKMKFKPVDRVLLRMGANDSLLNNQSTFMMEMEEVAYIVYHGTPNSLILMDELGRGTSTKDGIAIASAVIEYIGKNIKAKTICSTHYHELIDLKKEYSNVTNYHAEAKETEDGLELTYKIKSGGSPKSFGIEVAKRAGLPKEIINKATVILIDA